jgi:ElaB/YqjD/DUF883 family membrane-anchored ribosome-binding protein
MTNRDPLYGDPSPPVDDDFTSTTTPSLKEDVPQFAGNVTDTTTWENGDYTMGTDSSDDAAAGALGKAQEKAGEFSGKAEELTSKTQEKAGELGGKAHDKADQGMDAAASGLGQAADMLRQQGEQRGGAAGNAASKTADTLESASHYLRDKDTDQLMSDLESFVRQKPVESVLIAAGIGFVLSKIVR